MCYVRCLALDRINFTGNCKGSQVEARELTRELPFSDITYIATLSRDSPDDRQRDFSNLIFLGCVPIFIASTENL